MPRIIASSRAALRPHHGAAGGGRRAYIVAATPSSDTAASYTGGACPPLVGPPLMKRRPSAARRARPWPSWPPLPPLPGPHRPRCASSTRSCGVGWLPVAPPRAATRREPPTWGRPHRWRRTPGLWPLKRCSSARRRAGASGERSPQHGGEEGKRGQAFFRPSNPLVCPRTSPFIQPVTATLAASSRSVCPWNSEQTRTAHLRTSPKSGNTGLLRSAQWMATLAANCRSSSSPPLGGARRARGEPRRGTVVWPPQQGVVLGERVGGVHALDALDDGAVARHVRGQNGTDDAASRGAVLVRVQSLQHVAVAEPVGCAPRAHQPEQERRVVVFKHAGVVVAQCLAQREG